MNKKLLLESAPLKWKNERQMLESHIGGKCMVQVVYIKLYFVIVIRITTTDALSGVRMGGANLRAWA